MRDKLGRFIKGHKAIGGYEKGHKLAEGAEKGWFKKGCKSWNIGLKGKGICKPTSGSFKKGHTPWFKLHPELAPSGEKHHNWKNGRRKVAYGYIRIYQPAHPFCDRNKTVFEHRLVMEKHLGRYLTRKEVVHHINEIKTDNRIKNFMVFATRGYHSAFHRWGYCNPKVIIFNGRKVHSN